MLGEPAATYIDGQLEYKEPFSSRFVLDFGDRVGLREVFLCNLPEVNSTHKYLKVPNVEARFGTDPGIYNTLMGAMAKLLPREFLANQDNAKMLAAISMPLVKVTDIISGEAVAMRIDVRLKFCFFILTESLNFNEVEDLLKRIEERHVDYLIYFFLLSLLLL